MSHIHINIYDHQTRTSLAFLISAVRTQLVVLGRGAVGRTRSTVTVRGATVRRLLIEFHAETHVRHIQTLAPPTRSLQIAFTSFFL